MPSMAFPSRSTRAACRRLTRTPPWSISISISFRITSMTVFAWRSANSPGPWTFFDFRIPIQPSNGTGEGGQFVADFNLFPRDQIVGIFRGFQQESGLEFHADLVLPYRSDFQRIPMHGQFVLVQLETPDEAVLGRIASFSSEGKLSFGSGEEFNIRAVREERPIPEDLREQYLKYRINIRVLGVLRKSGSGLTFVPSHRGLPHVGSPVAFPSSTILPEIAGHNIDGADIGHLAFGEYIYAP